MSITDWLDGNGLVNGNVPPNEECPFLAECHMQTENCPSLAAGNLRPHDFSCAAARAFSLTKTRKPDPD